MIRALISLPLLVIILVLGGLYGAYGQADPCRALAVERARRAKSSIGLPLGGSIERWTRLETSQMSSTECAGDLLDSWGERLSTHWR